MNYYYKYNFYHGILSGFSSYISEKKNDNIIYNLY